MNIYIIVDDYPYESGAWGDPVDDKAYVSKDRAYKELDAHIANKRGEKFEKVETEDGEYYYDKTGVVYRLRKMELVLE